MSGEMFVSRPCAVAWQKAVELRDAGEPTRMQIVISKLKASGCERILMDEIISTGHDAAEGGVTARAMAESVRLAWIARRTRDAATRLGAFADSARDQLPEAIEAASQQLAAIEQDMGKRAATVSLRDASVEYAKSLTRPIETGIPTGIPRLDAILTGLRPEHTTLVAARTSVGKSALTLQICLHAASKGFGVLYLSLEMAPQVMTERVLSHVSKVDGRDLRARRMSPQGWAALQDAGKRIREMPVVFNASQSLTIVDILKLCADESRTMRKAGKTLNLVVLDHVGIVKPHGDASRQSQEQQVSNISRALRGIAERFDCHVIACAQVNRGAEQRTGEAKRPQLHDLRGSGSLEQDADNIVLVHRPRAASGLFLDVPAEIVVAKNRVSGELGMVQAKFDGATQTFTELDGEWR